MLSLVSLFTLKKNNLNILVTGGNGFIGTNFIKTLISKGYNVFNIDNLTYAAGKNNHSELSKNSKYFFVKGNICDPELIKNTLNEFHPNYIINFAAESHVDNSIKSSSEFIISNILGTFNLLEHSKNYYFSLDEKKKSIFRFHQISTDEVYGDMENELFHENSQYRPSSPYSASKASADHLVRAWNRTYKLPIIITNCSNNFGPYQFPEKLVPVIIINALKEKNIPVYGDGKQVRDWIYVSDHCDALEKCIANGKNGETYNIGSSNQLSNLDLIKMICTMLDNLRPRKNLKSYSELIKFVDDRPGHDRKYGINSEKAMRELDWRPKNKFKESIESTIQWYVDNKSWWQEIINNK